MKIKVACIHYREWRILSEAEIYKPHMYQMGGQVKQAIVYYDREREREKERERERETQKDRVGGREQNLSKSSP